MLILTRRLGEEIIIGDDITIAVLGVKGNQVRLGFKAPDNISIHRSEIYNRIKKALSFLTQVTEQPKDSANERH